jgi:hypothetical protein
MFIQRSLGVGYVEAWVVAPEKPATSAFRRLTSWADYAALVEEEGLSPEGVLWAAGAYADAVVLWGKPPAGLDPDSSGAHAPRDEV